MIKWFPHYYTATMHRIAATAWNQHFHMKRICMVNNDDGNVLWSRHKVHFHWSIMANHILCSKVQHINEHVITFAQWNTGEILVNRNTNRKSLHRLLCHWPCPTLKFAVSWSVVVWHFFASPFELMHSHRDPGVRFCSLLLFPSGRHLKHRCLWNKSEVSRLVHWTR